MAKSKAEPSKAKTAAKAGVAYVALKKLVKGAFAVAAVFAVGKVLRSNRAT